MCSFKFLFMLVCFVLKVVEVQTRVTGTEVGSLTSEWDTGGRRLVFVQIKSKILSRS